MSIANGIWGNGILAENANFDLMEPAYRGWRYTFKWIDFETAPGVFDFDYILDQLSKSESRGWDYSISIDISPAAGDSPKSPAWLFTAPYNVPLVTTTAGVYPYYFDATFKERYFNMLDALRNYIATLNSSYKEKFKYWLSTEGKTGDTGPYAGNITSVTIDGIEVDPGDLNDYFISDDDWQTYKRTEVWPLGYANLAADLPLTRYAINAGNDYADFQWGLDNIPGCGFKRGFPTHTYSNSFEKYDSTYINALSQGLTFGEFQNIEDIAWFQESYKQNFFSIVCSALHHGINIISINTGIPQQMFPADLTPFEFFNLYAPDIIPEENNIGFCALRDMIDVNDKVRFTEADYGNVINPASLTAYTNQYNNLPGTPAQHRQSKLTDLTIDYLNPARLAALQVLFPDAAYHTIDGGEDQDAYNQEFGVDLIPGNYCKNITQYSPNTTSIGVWCVGTTNSFYGRYGRAFDNANDKTEMFFTNANAGSFIYTATIKITYSNTAGGSWCLCYHNGTEKTELATVVMDGSGEKETLEFTIEDFNGGGLLDHSTDYSLKYKGGDDAIFFLVQDLYENPEPITTEPDAPMANSYKESSDYFSLIAEKSKLIAHNGAISGTARLRKSFHRVNDEDELNAACQNWGHFPCVVHINHLIRFKERGYGAPNKLLTNVLAFFSSAQVTGNVVVSDTIESAYDEAETAMNKYIAYMLNDFESNGSCGGMYMLDASRISAEKVGPVNGKLFGWLLTIEFEKKSPELNYDADDWTP